MSKTITIWQNNRKQQMNTSKKVQFTRLFFFVVEIIENIFVLFQICLNQKMRIAPKWIMKSLKWKQINLKHHSMCQRKLFYLNFKKWNNIIFNKNFSACFGTIIGAKGITIRRIQDETRTEIKIPRSNNNVDIKIYGMTRDAVSKARRRIEMIVTSCRHKRRPTHFTAVKISNSTILENFLKFKVFSDNIGYCSTV